MFINAHVFINSSVVYKLWWGGGEGSWNISARVPPPSPLYQAQGISVEMC